LAYYSEIKKGWRLEKGKYKVFIGNASDNIHKEIQVNIP